ncbi:MAG: hypothetical protein ABI980_14630 [Nitrospirota bacterium]
MQITTGDAYEAMDLVHVVRSLTSRRPRFSNGHFTPATHKGSTLSASMILTTLVA